MTTPSLGKIEGGAGQTQGGAPQEGVHSLDFILDIPLKVTVELGRTNSRCS